MNIIFKFFILLVVFVSITAMSRSPSEQSGNQLTASSKGKDDHAGHRTVKPHANIKIAYQLPKSFAIDVPETIEFTVINGRDADEVKVNFTVDDGLILNTAISEIRFGPATSASRHSFEIQLTPQQNGLFYINLFASMLIDNRYQTRSFAIPVSVGEYDLKKQRPPVGVISEQADGQLIITMPAVESSD